MPTCHFSNVVSSSPDCGEKVRWRLLRQFASPEDIQREFGMRLATAWDLREECGHYQEQAIKLLLAKTTAPTVQCECVSLFPRPASLAVSENLLRRKAPRATACVSSQPGCGVGCPFCATGSLGYRGNLSSADILEQVYWCGIWARKHGHRLRNVVFMGMGEPLHNAQAVHEALAVLTSETGFGLASRHITVSTVGVPSKMQRLASAFPDVRLALSLHAAIPSLRKQLVPRAVGDLELLRNSLREINALQAQPVWLELVLIQSLNDSRKHAESLVDFCDGLHVEVNLIPYNSSANVQMTSPGFEASSQERREQFARVVRQAGIRCTLRSSFGSQHEAACGQLSGKHEP